MDKLLLFTEKDHENITMDEWLEGKNPALRSLVLKWFEYILGRASDVVGIFHDDCPVACVSDAPFAYVNAYTNHVSIGFFYGADLHDEKKLLEGAGKRMRHIKLKPNLESDDAAIKSLIDDAYFDIRHRLGGR